MKINKNFKVREVAGEYIVVNQGQPDGDMTQLISLNATAYNMWKAFEGKEFTVECVADMLKSTFGIDDECARHDALAWISSLKNAGAISE